MRSTAFALLGITAAMGLGLVAIISQQDWPLLPAAPLPALPAEHGGIDPATTVAGSEGRRASRSAAAARAGQGSANRAAGTGAPASRLSGSRKLETAPLQPPSDPGAAGDPDDQGTPTEPPAGDQPVGGSFTAAPDPAPPPSAASSPPVPEPVAVTASANRGKGNAYGKYKAASGAKGKSHHSGAKALPPPAPAVIETDADPAVGVQPPADDPAGEKSNGRGHAYGHAGK